MRHSELSRENSGRRDTAFGFWFFFPKKRTALREGVADDIERFNRKERQTPSNSPLERGRRQKTLHHVGMQGLKNLLSLIPVSRRGSHRIVSPPVSVDTSLGLLSQTISLSRAPLPPADQSNESNFEPRVRWRLRDHMSQP